MDKPAPRYNELERATYRTHVRASIFDGAYNAVIGSAGDVAVKNLGAQEYNVMVMHMAAGVAQLFTLVVGRIIEAGSRRTLFLYPAIFGRLPIIALFFNGDPWFFTGLLVLQSLSNVTMIPALNSIFRHNYRDENRGTLYGKAAVWAQFTSGCALIGFGYWLDVDDEAFRTVFPVAAIAGVVACIFFARMPSTPGSTAAGGGRTDIFFAFRILARDRLFLLYEAAFMLYGLAFMATITAKPIFAVNVLALSNMQLLGARAIFSFTIVLCTPLMGRLMDRWNGAGLATASFALLFVHMLVLTFADGWEVYFVAEGILGVAMAGVLLSWNIGPVSFATAGESVHYMAVHVALVGVRALVGHPLGAIVTDHIGAHVVFAISAGLLVVATINMARVAPRLRERLARERERP